MSDSKTRAKFILNAFRRNKEKNKNDEDREAESWGFFSGVNGAQWNQSARETLRAEGRPDTQMNLVQGKVLAVLGHFLQNPLDAKFESDVGAPEWGAQVMNQLLMSDKDNGHWEDEEKQFILSTLVHSGVLEIYKDYSLSPLGNLAVRHVPHDSISFDYRWRSQNLDDCPRVFVYRWMDAKQIKSTYKKKSQEIEEAIKFIDQLIVDAADNTEEINKLCDRSPDVFDSMGSQYLVIQLLELEDVNKLRLFSLETYEFLPDMSEEVAKAIYKLPQNAGKYELVPDTVRRLNVTTVCPGLSKDLLLEDGPHPIQIGGYPYITASSLNLNGERQGIVEVMKGPQETINKRESTLTHHQMTRANGVEFIESDAFEDEATRKDYVENGNVPGKKVIVAPGVNREQKIKTKLTDAVPGDLVDSITRATSHMDRMWAPPPLLASGGKSGESAKLFNDKKEQALVALEYVNKTIWKCQRLILDKYFKAAKVVYAKIPRKFSVDSDTELLINWPSPDGSIINNIADIPRLPIRIVQSQNSASIKRERLDIYSQFGQFISTPAVKAGLELMMIDAVPEIPKEQRESLKNAQMEYIGLLRERTAAERLQIQIGMQAQMARAGGMAPSGPSAPGETPAEGGGFTAEGKPIDVAGGVPVDVRSQNQLK